MPHPNLLENFANFKGCLVYPNHILPLLYGPIDMTFRKSKLLLFVNLWKKWLFASNSTLQTRIFQCLSHNSLTYLDSWRIRDVCQCCPLVLLGYSNNCFSILLWQLLWPFSALRGLHGVFNVVLLKNVGNALFRYTQRNNNFTHSAPTLKHPNHSDLFFSCVYHVVKSNLGFEGWRNGIHLKLVVHILWRTLDSICPKTFRRGLYSGIQCTNISNWH